MTRLIAPLLATLTTAAVLTSIQAAAPALALPERKTELIETGGNHVDQMQLLYNFDAAWVVDNQNILYRDVRQDYYLVTLKSACQQIEVRGRRFDFFPSWSPELFASHKYEVRPEAGPHCGVAKIAQVDDTRAITLRDSSQRRVW
jgi:hypothetical protein